MEVGWQRVFGREGVAACAGPAVSHTPERMIYAQPTVGNELVISRPDSDGSPALSLLLFGGAALRAAQSWYLQLTAGTVPRAHWVACAVLVAGDCAAVALSRLAGLGLLLIVMGALTWHLIRNQSRA